MMPESEEPLFGVRVFGQASYVAFTAKQSFQAILGSSNGQMFGGGVYLRYGPAFLQLSVSRYQKSGERVFQFEGRTYPLGVKDTVTVTPMVAIVGVRLLKRGRVGVYVGGGVGAYSFKESSDFEDPSEGVDKSFTSYHAIAGVEIYVSSWAALALEGHYASVPNAIGQGGVSSSFAETNLGGAGAQVKLLLGK
jgi:opacity protein-like surface antigen